MNAIVITGTDTGVGKTVVSAMLVLALDGCYWKPIQSGLTGQTDSEAVAALTGVPAARILPEAYRLREPLSPHRAAELDGMRIDPDHMNLPRTDRLLIVEGAGGVLVPLTRSALQVDLFARWRAPVVVVARTTLGTINHTLLAIEALRHRSIALLGVIFVGDENPDTQRSIAEFGEVNILARIPFLDPLDASGLRSVFTDGFMPQDFGLARREAV